MFFTCIIFPVIPPSGYFYTVVNLDAAQAEANPADLAELSADLQA